MKAVKRNENNEIKGNGKRRNEINIYLIFKLS